MRESRLIRSGNSSRQKMCKATQKAGQRSLFEEAASE